MKRLITLLILCTPLLSAQSDETAKAEPSSGPAPVVEQTRDPKSDKEDVDKIGDRDVDGGVNFYSIEKEIRLGRELAAEIERNAKIIDDPVISEYVTQNFETGVRSAAYDRSPYTFGQFGTLYQTRIDPFDWTGGLPQVHRDGEIWATVLWDVRQAVGKSVFEQAVVAGLSMTPARPSMLDARDAMLTASDALFGSHVTCAMWGVFAKRGFGASAALNPIQDNAPRDTALSVFEAFDLPASCGGAAKQEGGTLLQGGEATGGWHMTGLWHVSSRRVASGSAAYWFGSEASGGYDTGARARGALTSPEIDLTGVEEPVLEWSQYLDGEGFGRSYRIWSGPSAPYLNYDAGRLLISLDGGSNWSTLTHLAHNTAGAEFDRYRINLSRFAGQRIRLRFVFDTLDEISNGHEGWFIDDVRIFKLVNAQRLNRSTIRLRLPGTDQSRPAARRPPMR